MQIYTVTVTATYEVYAKAKSTGMEEEKKDFCITLIAPPFFLWSDTE